MRTYVPHNGSDGGDTIVRNHYTLHFFSLSIRRTRTMILPIPQIAIGMADDRFSHLLVDHSGKSDDNDEDRFLLTIFGRGPIQQRSTEGRYIWGQLDNFYTTKLNLRKTISKTRRAIVEICYIHKFLALKKYIW